MLEIISTAAYFISYFNRRDRFDIISRWILIFDVIILVLSLIGFCIYSIKKEKNAVKKRLFVIGFSIIMICVILFLFIHISSTIL